MTDENMTYPKEPMVATAIPAIPAIPVRNSASTSHADVSLGIRNAAPLVKIVGEMGDAVSKVKGSEYVLSLICSGVGRTAVAEEGESGIWFEHGCWKTLNWC